MAACAVVAEPIQSNNKSKARRTITVVFRIMAIGMAQARLACNRDVASRL